MSKWEIVVRQTGRTWGVFFRRPGHLDKLLEGGFSCRDAAIRCRDQWERDCLQNEVEAAERGAGWDPKP